MNTDPQNESWKNKLIAGLASFAAMIAASRWLMAQLARRAVRMWF